PSTPGLAVAVRRAVPGRVQAGHRRRLQEQPRLQSGERAPLRHLPARRLLHHRRLRRAHLPRGVRLHPLLPAPRPQQGLLRRRALHRRRDLPALGQVRPPRLRAPLLRPQLQRQQRLPRRLRLPPGRHRRHPAAAPQPHRRRPLLRPVFVRRSPPPNPRSFPFPFPFPTPQPVPDSRPKQLRAPPSDNGAMARLAPILLLLLTASARAAPKRQLEGVVNVNTASPDELQLLSGVGPAKVRNILAYRTKHPFRTVEEIVRIKGIGRKMFRRLRMHLAVSGPTTAQQVIRAAPDPAAPAAL